MKARLDNGLCQGHGRCYALAPDVFDCDDEGYAVVKVDGELTDAQAADARLAADNCPEAAVLVFEDTTVGEAVP